MMLFDAQRQSLAARRRMADAAVMPRFALTAQGWYGYPGLDMFTDIMEYRWSLNGIVGIQMQWNISGFNTWKNNLRKIEASQLSLDIQRDRFSYNDRLQTTQIKEAIHQMTQVLLHDDEIIRLRSSIRQASEAQVQNGTMTVAELLKDVNSEAQARLQKTMHNIEHIKNIYSLIN